MKVCEQLGLLCLSLLICSLHGEEIDGGESMDTPVMFDEEDIPQLQMYRVRRQTEEENAEQTEVAMQKREKGKTGKPKRPRSGYLSVLRDNGGPESDINLRVKRQEKIKNNKRKKPRPGQFSLLGSSRPDQQTVRAKREETAGGKSP
ncbi:uncharacterized protein si:ch211-106h4.12 isoform X1 [Danio aesculapii]|uniref:uncharacterized protein si:ch211-106h4.12 isoform X1 n=1 Tax=Danio aesculapii TaxID=1142201 RepID=UPI0024BF6CDF|nr:uncharacterized protein si:ch211-106h4.12 isoform X1 [Danio aesculapii]